MKDKTFVLVCYGRSTISKLISIFTKSKITHVGFKVILEGKVFIAESQKDGFQLKTYENWAKQFKYKYEEYEVPSSYKDVRLNIYDNLSQVPYDFRLFVLRYPRHILSKMFNRKDKLDSVRNEEKRQICSESVAFCLGWGSPESYLPITVSERIILEGWVKTNQTNK